MSVSGALGLFVKPKAQRGEEAPQDAMAQTIRYPDATSITLSLKAQKPPVVDEVIAPDPPHGFFPAYSSPTHGFFPAYSSRGSSRAMSTQQPDLICSLAFLSHVFLPSSSPLGCFSSLMCLSPLLPTTVPYHVDTLGWFLIDSPGPHHSPKTQPPRRSLCPWACHPLPQDSARTHSNAPSLRSLWPTSWLLIPRPVRERGTLTQLGAAGSRGSSYSSHTKITRHIVTMHLLFTRPVFWQTAVKHPEDEAPLFFFLFCSSAYY